MSQHAVCSGWLLALWPHSKKVLGFLLGLSVGYLHVLSLVQVGSHQVLWLPPKSVILNCPKVWTFKKAKRPLTNFQHPTTHPPSPVTLCRDSTVENGWMASPHVLQLICRSQGSRIIRLCSLTCTFLLWNDNILSLRSMQARSGISKQILFTQRQVSPSFTSTTR